MYIYIPLALALALAFSLLHLRSCSRSHFLQHARNVFTNALVYTCAFMVCTRVCAHIHRYRRYPNPGDTCLAASKASWRPPDTQTRTPRRNTQNCTCTLFSVSHPRSHRAQILPHLRHLAPTAARF